MFIFFPLIFSPHFLRLLLFVVVLRPSALFLNISLIQSNYINHASPAEKAQWQ